MHPALACGAGKGRVVDGTQFERQLAPVAAELAFGDQRRPREIEHDAHAVGTAWRESYRRDRAATRQRAARPRALEVERDALRLRKDEARRIGDRLVEAQHDPVVLHLDAFDRRRPAGSAGKPAGQQCEEERHRLVMQPDRRGGKAKRRWLPGAGTTIGGSGGCGHAAWVEGEVARPPCRVRLMPG